MLMYIFRPFIYFSLLSPFPPPPTRTATLSLPLPRHDTPILTDPERGVLASVLPSAVFLTQTGSIYPAPELVHVCFTQHDQPGRSGAG